MSERKGTEPFNLVATLRLLAAWLIKQDGVPKGYAEPLPLGSGGAPISDAEHGFFVLVATAHMSAHDIGEPRPGMPPQCPNKGGTCRSQGVARAMLCGCERLRDLSAVPHVERLRHAFWEARGALKALDDELAAYLDVCRQLHENGRWKDISLAEQMRGHEAKQHDHVNVCVVPEEMREDLRGFMECIDAVDEVSLLPQFASSTGALSEAPGRKPQPYLVSEMQAVLFLHGWTLEEIATVIDDGRGGTLAQVKERMRKRLSPWIK